MFERLGLGDHSVVINTMLMKLANNLKIWAEEEDIICQTLRVLDSRVLALVLICVSHLLLV